MPVHFILHVDSSHCLISFLFNLKDFFSISMEDLLAMTSIILRLSESVFNSYLFLKGRLVAYRIIFGCLFFSFSPFNVSSHCFLDSIVSHENSHQSKILTNCGLPVVEPFFSHCCEDFLFQLDYHLSRCVFFQLILLEVCRT